MKLIYTFIAISILTVLSCSTTESETIPLVDELVKNENSLLWKIEKEGHKTSYIFGTMHMIEEEFYDFTPHMEEIIDQSDEIVMEIGGQPNPLEALAMMTLKEGKVEDFFTEVQLSKLVAFMDTKMNIDPKQFHQIYSSMKPFFILQTITQAYFTPTAVSYDMNIMQMAGEKDIPLSGFETLEEQLGFFDKIPSEGIAEMIMTSVDNFEEEKKETMKLQKLYAKEKVDKLIPMMKNQSPEFMAFEDIFLTNRNKAWIPQIIEKTTSNKCFIAVGAAHLFDTNGVINLLKQKGFTLTAVKK
jgi:uncharacterized protein YbaP (TraB family)